MIADKITSPVALSYLLNLGIRGAQRLIRRGYFTEPQSVAAALESYMTDNSTVLSWLEDCNITEDHCLELPRDMLYSEFVDWCKLSGVKPTNITGKKAFFKELIQKFEFEEKPKKKVDGKRYFIQKI